MPKILYFVTDDSFFVSHFLPMARAARSAGFDVVVATRARDHVERLRAEGCRLVALKVRRHSLGIFELVRNVRQMARIVRDEKPDIVHCIALRMVVAGGVAARLSGVERLVLAPTGLGFLWINDSVAMRTARSMVRYVVGRFLNRPGTRYLFENSEDPAEFGLDLASDPITLVPGAGIDLAEFPVSPEPEPPIKVAVVARALKTKGIAEAVAAVQAARSAGADIELSLFGAPDPGNRQSFSEEELIAFSRIPGISWRGHTTDVPGVWRSHHLALLLSYREGLPRSLIEAAAAGRPIVAADVTGCRELVRDGREGFLVPLGNVAAAADALTRLAADASLRDRMGLAARRRVVDEYTEERVCEIVGQVYKPRRPLT